MPLPWKKAAGLSRISRFITDLQPTKPCSSMVVQTGFPTSLVDLFVKNSDRLKKPIKKKKKHHHKTPHHRSPAVHDPDPVLSPGAGDFPGEEEEEEEEDRVNFKIKGNLDVGRFEINQESSDEGLNKRDRRGVLYAVFMVFVVLILALIGIKILTLGITMSACFLIFVDYIRKHIFQLPLGVFLCKEDKRQLLLTERKEEDEQQEEEGGGGEGEDSVEMNSPAREIRVIESRFDAFAVEPDNNDGRGMNLMSGRWGYSEEDESEAIIPREKQHKLRRRASRELIKKLVPKKWRAMKKARKGKESTTTTTEESGSDQSISSHSSRIEEIEELCNKSSHSSRNEEIEELYNSDSKQSKLSDSSTELGTKSENETSVIEKPYKGEAVIRKERKGGGGCAILLLVALAGLVGGRILALALTVASCVIIQLVRRPRKQSVKKTV